VDIQRTLALEESKETSIQSFRLQTPRCNSDTREKARPCMFEYQEDKIRFFQNSIAHEKE